MKIYLDTCCYCRPFDESDQDKIVNERAAIAAILNPLMDFDILGSLAVKVEFNRISDSIKREDVELLYNSVVSAHLPYTLNIKKRADALTAIGVGKYDSFHIAFAESAKADYLLTVDKKFVNKSNNLKVSVKVINPLDFIGGNK
ncbi:MAG: hypothetical protein LBI42_01070 [Chitinispirillales bacterium]|jgi:predicted nucleic acid-binding protein|nr:hypothetical protein [Chitinispirillales bacterium]